MAAADHVGLADELVDAARAGRLIAVGMVGFRMRIVALLVADRLLAAEYEVRLCSGIAHRLLDLRHGVAGIVPPFPHVWVREPAPQQWQVRGRERPETVGSRHRPNSAPKFVIHGGVLSNELRKQRGTSNPMIASAALDLKFL